jgi:hypothetical protein
MVQYLRGKRCKKKRSTSIKQTETTTRTLDFNRSVFYSRVFRIQAMTED